MTLRAALPLSLALSGALHGAAWADMVCIAETQCRGDAQEMCAPSALRVEVRGDALWIDRQGPYTAERRSTAAGATWRLPLFQGHALSVADSGAFTYRGNRGKRYTGTCAEIQS
jgi:hypothetical protein